jgi:hypothetical protein
MPAIARQRRRGSSPTREFGRSTSVPGTGVRHRRGPVLRSCWGVERPRIRTSRQSAREVPRRSSPRHPSVGLASPDAVRKPPILHSLVPHGAQRVDRRDPRPRSGARSPQSRSTPGFGPSDRSASPSAVHARIGRRSISPSAGWPHPWRRARLERTRLGRGADRLPVDGQRTSAARVGWSGLVRRRPPLARHVLEVTLQAVPAPRVRLWYVPHRWVV